VVEYQRKKISSFELNKGGLVKKIKAILIGWGIILALIPGAIVLMFVFLAFLVIFWIENRKKEVPNSDN